MHPDTTQPRIYVASLSDYNAGRLHGIWVDADQPVEDIESDVHSMLSESREPDAEEYAIHDYEGFGPVRFSEYDTLATVATIAAGIAEHGRAFAHWANHVGAGDREDLARFEDCFQGAWFSIGQFVEQLLDGLGIDLDDIVPEFIAPYVHFDEEAFARDLASTYLIIEEPDMVYVFEP